eukprot:Gb_17296 [translate_table: standard]
MRCGEIGTTRLLFIRIPHFREVVLMAFRTMKFKLLSNYPQGCYYMLKVFEGEPKILNRQVVKSDYVSINVLELDFIPLEAQRGTLSTIEGTLSRDIDELQVL